MKYAQQYFKGIYAHLKKEKKLIHRSFLNLLLAQNRKINNVLDLGCGEGDFLKICQEKKLKCFGADLSSYALKKAKEKVRGEFKKINLEKEKLPWPDEFFDAVTAFDLVEHLKKTNFLFAEVNHAIDPVGFVGPDGHTHRIETLVKDILAVPHVPYSFINKQGDHDTDGVLKTVGTILTPGVIGIAP